MTKYEKLKILANERWQDENGNFDLEWFLHNFDVTAPNTYESYFLMKHGRLPNEPESIQNSNARVIHLVLGIFVTLELGEKFEGFRVKRYLQERDVYKEVYNYILETMKNMRKEK